MMEFTTWFQQWLRRHPLKEPPETARARLTAGVMVRVRALDTASGRIPLADLVRRWAFRPRWVLAAATAAVGIAIAVVATRQSSHQLAQTITRESQLLAALEEPDGDLVREDHVEALADELALTDTLVLAEAPPDDQQWITQTLQLLDQLGEDVPSGTTADTSDNDPLNELQRLDEQDLSAAS